MLILRRQFGRFDYRIEGVCVGWLRGGGGQSSKFNRSGGGPNKHRVGGAGKTLKLLHGRGVYSGLQSTVCEYQLVIVIPTLSRLVTLDRGVISSSIPEKNE